MTLRTTFLVIITALTLIAAAPSAGRADGKKLGKELYEAVLFQNLEEMKKLIANGADVNHMENGRPILGWAAQNGNVEVVKALLAGRANPNVADEGVGHTPLMRAIDTHQLEIVKELLKAKADPNLAGATEDRALTMAIATGKPEFVQALIGGGADVARVSAEGDSAVLAATMEDTEAAVRMVGMLGKAGAPMNVSNAAYTPLSYAVEQGNKDLVTALLDAGADPNAATKSGRAPINLVSDNLEILELLLKAKADPNIESEYGSRPLSEAIQGNQPGVAKALIDAGADVAKPLPNGQTMLELAKQNGQTEIVALIEKQTGVTVAPTGVEAAGKEGARAGFDMSGFDGTCTIGDAAIKQMELHQLLQKQVDAGKMSSEIFRTFNDDTKDYGRMLEENNPNAACALFARLKKKYGV